MNQQIVAATLESDGLQTLLSKICPSERPVFVVVEPRRAAIENECFYNVRDTVEDCGGDVVFGWAIWECPSTFIEAEQHAVWQRPDGKLIDVTPKKDDEDEILFVRSKKAKFYFARPNWQDNVRLSTSSDPVVAKILKLTSRIKKLEIKYSVPDGRKRKLRLTEKAKGQIQRLINERNNLAIGKN